MSVSKKSEEIVYMVLRKIPKFFRKPAIIVSNNLRKLSIRNLKTPINLTLYVTNRCNAQCSHCFYRDELNKPCEELTLEQLKKIAKSLKHPLQTLMITGGEPFLRNDLADICKIFLKINKTRRITLNTNGMFTKKIIGTVRKVLSLNPQTLHVQISLDGPKQLHDKIRGVSGCFARANETLNQLEKMLPKNPNMELSIMTTIWSGNYKDILPFCKEMAKKHPNTLHKFNIVRGSRTGTYNLPESIISDLDTEVEQVPIKALEKLFGNINKIVAKNKDEIWAKSQKLKLRNSVEMLKNKKKLFNCLAGITFGVIYPNGDVTICEPVKPFANLKDFDYNFYKLWNSKAAEKIKRMTRECYCIHPCNLLDSMAYDTKSLIKLFGI